MRSAPFLPLVLLFGAAQAVVGNAEAHAIIVDSSPAANATIAGPQFVVRLHFNSRIDQARSRITLVAPDGTSRALPDGGSAEPDILSARADGLAPGRYTLRWQVLAVDGHITRGDIPFEVAP